MILMNPHFSLQTSFIYSQNSLGTYCVQATMLIKWFESLKNLAWRRVATNLQFVKKIQYLKHTKVKHNGNKYVL